jgi:hypothetical protein
MSNRRISVLALMLGMTGASFGCSQASNIPPAPGSEGLDGGGAGGSSGDATTSSGTEGGAVTKGGSSGGAAEGGAAEGGATADGAAGGAAEGGATEGGAATEGGSSGGASNADGAATEGGGSGAGGDAATGPSGPPPPGPVCSQTATWGAGTELAISASSDATSLDNNLGAITPDELTIAWTIGTGSSAVIAYADRAADTDPFGEPQTLSASSFAQDRVAVSPDGLRLVVVSSDRQGFLELTRTARSGASNTFGAASVGSYSNFVGILPMGESFGDPVLSADDNTFYYSIYGRPGETDTIARTTRLVSTDAWPSGALLPATSVLAEEQEEVTLRRRPTAISSDDQTLFYWDEVSGTERATWINTSTGVFTGFVDLGARQWANPNTACTRLYYSDQPGAASLDGATALDLFVCSN